MTFFKSKIFKEYTKLSPLILVDVGARGGPHRRWRQLSENLMVFGFEPDEEEFRKLNEKAKKNYMYFPIALFDKKGTIDINITKYRGSSSVYLPHPSLLGRFFGSEGAEIIQKIKVPCHTLEGLVKEENIPDVDFLKIDTEGSELKILEGAKELLKNQILGIEVELGFYPFHQNQPLFWEVDKYLRELGFILFDLSLFRDKRKKYPEVYSKGQVLCSEALYFKDILEENLPSNYLTFEKAAKMMAIAELYGYSDFSLELLDFYTEKKIIDQKKSKEIRRLLRKKILKNIFSWEYQLFDISRHLIGNYLMKRTPWLHKLITKIRDKFILR